MTSIIAITDSRTAITQIAFAQKVSRPFLRKIQHATRYMMVQLICSMMYFWIENEACEEKPRDMVCNRTKRPSNRQISGVAARHRPSSSLNRRDTDKQIRNSPTMGKAVRRCDVIHGRPGSDRAR